MNTLQTAISLLCLLAITTGNWAHAQTPPPAAVQFQGSVQDRTGGVMVGVTVRVFQEAAAEPFRETVTDNEGNFALELSPGPYRVEVSAPAFATFTRVVEVAPEMAPLSVALQLGVIPQTVAVSTEAEQLIADTTISLTSTTLSGNELLNLPQNEEDLARYLLMLAGADVTGDLEEDVLANFIVDGFNDGRLPRPDQISQIIIDPNSLSADGSGPRIEIVTRPGSGGWRRSLNFNFADESLNALTPGETRKPARQTRDLEIELSGPVIPNLLEMDFELSTRNDEQAANSLRAITPGGNFFAGVVRPEVQREFSVDGEIDLGGNHSLDIGFNYSTERSQNSGVGGFTLPERGSNDKGRDWSVEVSERMFGDDYTNDFQFQFGRGYSRKVPLSDGFAIDVADAFNGGGGTGRSIDEETTIQVENRLRWERGEWNFQVGGEAQYETSLSTSEDNFNGTFEFASLHDYCYATDFFGVNCQPTRQIVDAALAQGGAPRYLNARGQEVEITGKPTTFTQASGNSQFEFSEFGFNTFVQADRGFGEKASLRMGLRYEATNHSIAYLRINPTINMQYRLFEDTLLSFGSQLNFQDFRETERMLRNDGSTYRRELSISSPSFPDPFQGGTVEIDEESSSLYVLDPDYQSPYNIRPQFGLNQQLPGGIRLTLSYRVDYGIHQQRTRNINAPYPGGPLPDEILSLPGATQREVIDRMRPFYPTIGNIRQIESTGRSVSKDFSMQFRPRGELELLGLELAGNFGYNYRTGKDDNDFNNPYIREWGLTQRQHVFQSQFRIRMPDAPSSGSPLLRALAGATYGGTNLNFNFRAETGRLYSITSGSDLNGDQSGRDRPLGVPRNSEVGPGSWNLDMTFTKEFRIESNQPEINVNAAFPPQNRGGGGDDDDDDGDRGGGFGGGQGSDTRIRFQARVNNLLNHSQPRGYSGVLSSPFFGQPTGYTGGRTINLSMNIDF